MSLYRRTLEFSATQPKENEEAIVTQLTIVRGRHHGCTMVFARTKFSTLLLLHGYNISWASMGIKIYLNEGKMV